VVKAAIKMLRDEPTQVLPIPMPQEVLEAQAGQLIA
jgi:hypothetical protein